MKLITLGSLAKWNPTASVLLWLPYFSWRNALKAHPYCGLSEFPSILRLRSIPVCVDTTFGLSRDGHVR